MNKKNKIFIYLSLLPLLPALLFIVALYRYNIPTRDDYAYSFLPHYNNYDFFAHLKTVISGGGRMMSNFLYSFFLSSGIDFTSYRIITFIFFTLFLLILLANIFIVIRKHSILDKFAVFIIISSTWLFSLRSMRDSIFWFGGVINYLLPLTLAFLCVMLLIKLYYSRNLYINIIIIAMALMTLFVIPFGTEVLGMALLALLFIMAIISTFNPNLKKLRVVFYLGVVIVFSALLISYLSPSVSVRAESGYGGRFFWSVWVSLMTNFERTFETVVISMIIPASILIYFLLLPKELPKLFLKYSLAKNALAIYLIGFITTWAAQFTISFAMGYTGLPDRAKMIPQTITLLTYIIGNIYLLHSFKIEQHIKRIKLFIIVIVLFMYIMQFTSREFLGSLYSLGSFKNYADRIEERHNFLENKVGKKGDIVFDSIDVEPLPITDNYLTDNCNALSNSCITYYFKIDGCVKLDKNDGVEFKKKMRLMHLRQKFD